MAAKDRGPIGRFVAWLGYGPEAEPEQPEPVAPPSARQRDAAEPRRTDADDAIRAAAEAAERRARDEILALEEDLDRAKSETEEARRGIAEADRLRIEAEERARRAEQELEDARRASERELAERTEQIR